MIFGFALSIIVISLEVPRTYDALMDALRGFLPFACCFAIFVGIWPQLHRFFRRYALIYRTTTALNMLLLFVVLFYVYPLKFMFVLIGREVIGQEQTGLTVPQARTLFVIYGLGFIAVNWLLAAMYRHAEAKADALQLTAIERIDTRRSIYDNLATGAFGLLSILLAYTAIGFAGPVYFLLFIPKTLIPFVMGSKRRRLEVSAP